MSDQDTSAHKASGAGSAAAGLHAPKLVGASLPGPGYHQGWRDLVLPPHVAFKKSIIIIIIVFKAPKHKELHAETKFQPAGHSPAQQGRCGPADGRGTSHQALLGVASGLASAQGLCRFDTSS